MHGVTSETFYIDAVVVEYMTIKSIIVPHFQMLLALEVRLKVVYQSSIMPEIIHKNFWSSSKI